MSWRLRFAATGAIASMALLAVPAAASAVSVDVSIGGGKLNIAAASGTSMGTQVDYLVAEDKWRVLDSFATAGSGCVDVSSAVVTCPENGEDIDVDFSNTGGSVSLALADINLDFDSTIALGTATENVTAGNGVDIVTAAAATVNGDNISTLDGNDQTTTGGGSDIINGGDDADVIVAGEGNNIVNGGEFAGDDSGDGNDTITGGSIQDTLDGGMGEDTINGGGDNDTIDGANDNDTINAGPGDDGSGVATVQGGAGNDTMNGGDGIDTMEGEGGDDTLNGDGGNDILDGGANTDDMNGGADNDTLNNSDGADDFDGGANGTGGDTVDYGPTTAAATMTIDIDNIADDGRNCPGGSCENDNVTTSVENVTGDGSADTITGSSGPNVIDGAGGNDTLAGGAGTGADGADTFANNTGTDTVTYAGRTGAITADIDASADDGSSGEGDKVSVGIENMIGGSAGDNLTGDSVGNVLSGGAGTANDTLNGAGANDTLNGSLAGATVADGADTFNGGANTDSVSYAGRTAVLTADLDGAAGDDPDGDTLGTDVENLTGGSGGDTLTGNVSANVLAGGAGSDTLAGGASAGADGADSFVGGTNGSIGDTVTYAARTGAITADIDATIGDDTDGDTVGAEIENLTGGSAGDALTGDGNENILRGGPGTGNDTLNGLGADDGFFGGTGSNTGPDGADTFNAGTQGTVGDGVSYNGRTDNISAGIGGGADSDGDNVTSAIDNLIGGNGNDTLTGDADANAMRGGDGNDVLSGSASVGADAADRFDGGSGIDTASYATRTDDLGLDLNGTADDGANTGTEDDIIETDVENLTGGAGDDDLVGDADANVLDGGGGDDDLVSGPATGPDGADTYIGGSNGTVGGQNVERGDRAFFSARQDPLTIDIGGGADDTDGDDIRDDVENLTGGGAADTLTGDGDANILDGRFSDDTLSGGPGPGPDGADTFTGGTGTDTVDYSARTDNLTVDLTAGTGPDGDIIESSARDILISGAGDDSITGDALANTLEGGAGSDDLFGLAGADILRARDGEHDDVDCGDDVDTAIIDEGAIDTQLGCETLDQPLPSPPQTTITRHPPNRTRSRTATFEFIADEAATFECALDGAAFTPCTSPKTLTGLRRRTRHTFKVRATDLAGAVDATPASFSWFVKRRR